MYDALVKRIDERAASVQSQLATLGRKENVIMADVRIAQETLDADGDKLSQVASDLKSVIDAGNLPEADQSKLQAGLDALSGLDTLNVTPPDAGV